jgi:hypothetical protein
MQVVLATFFFIYIKLIAHSYHSDILIVAVVAGLWLIGGYMNTRYAAGGYNRTNFRALHIYIRCTSCKDKGRQLAF